jgi:3-methyl-2-oxobutanoate hydroxymethyltransferase
MNVMDFQSMKKSGKKISMLTCYDYTSAAIMDGSNVDILLVGDSLAMVMHGHTTTLPADIELMALHTSAVVRGAPSKFIVADLPFLSYRKDLNTNMRAIELVMKAGAHAVKLEGAVGNLDLIQHIVQSGVPVMGHLGLTPQSIHQLGGFKVQAKSEDHAELLVQHCKQLEEAGCFSLVLECVPGAVAEKATRALSIPTIGIGAGPETDGQVLVMQDMLGLNNKFKPKFLRHYLNGFEQLQSAFNSFDADVKSGAFPNVQESYS